MPEFLKDTRLKKFYSGVELIKKFYPELELTEKYFTELELTEKFFTGSRIEFHPIYN